MNPPDGEPLHFLDYWRVIKVHKFVVLTVFVLVVATAGIYTALVPREYDSIARIDVNSNRAVVSIYGRDSEASMEQVSFNTQFEIIQSKEVLYPVIEQLKLRSRWQKKGVNEELSKDLTYLMLKRKLKMSVQRGTTIIIITARSTDREEAAEIANAAAKGYEKFRLDEKVQETNRGIEKIEQEYKLKEEAVQKARDQVERLRKELKITDIGALNQATSIREEQEKLRRRENDLSEARTQLARQRARVDVFEKLDVSTLKNTLEALQLHGHPGLTDIIIRVMEAERKLTELTNGTFGPNHPEVRQARAAYETGKAQLNDKLKGILQAEKIKFTENEQTVKTLEAEVADLQKKEQESHGAKYEPFLKAVREAEMAQVVMKDVFERLQKEKIERGQPSTPVKVTDFAEASAFPSRPKVALNMILSVLVGMIMGVSVAFLLEYLDTSIHKVEDIEKYLRIPVLGVVPRDVKALVQMEDSSPYSEYYRVLRANIEFSRKDVQANAITFCSAGASEGKSTTLVNTAYIYAQHGQTVLIVDSDIRRPSLHRVFGVENKLGLTDIVLKGVAPEKVIRATHIPNIHFIPSGGHHADALGLVAMERMKELIAQFKSWYSMVFFDSPPVLGISDATILAREVDLAVLVIQAHRFPRQFVIRAHDILEKSGVRLLGAILNQVKSQENEYYSYNYEYYYGGKGKKG